jgi:hypothetical protein
MKTHSYLHALITSTLNRWMVSFTRRPLYPNRTSMPTNEYATWGPIRGVKARLVAQAVWTFSAPPPRFEPRVLHRSQWSIGTRQTELPRLTGMAIMSSHIITERTYTWLTPCRTTLAQPITNCSALYGNRTFIVVFTKSLKLPYPERNQSSPQSKPHFFKIRFKRILPS